MSSFTDSLAAGRKGEEVIANAHGGLLQPAHSPFDVWIPVQPKGWTLMPEGAKRASTGPGLKIEVKTDSRSHLDTPFAYVERWSVRPDGSRLLGGLWRARRDKVDALVYYYAPSGYALWLWNLDKLCTLLDMTTHIQPHRWKRQAVGNPDVYQALGRLIPRKDLIEHAGTAYREVSYDLSGDIHQGAQPPSSAE